jgi:YjbE family integral membrane protein
MRHHPRVEAGTETLTAMTRIILINIVLSGDNAVVIGMAAHSLHEKQRKLAILIGGSAAVVLRISGTAAAAALLQVPGLKVLGGVLLIWIAFNLLKEEEQEHEHSHASSSLRSAITTILLADFVMSLDNVLAVAAVANRDMLLLVFGLLLSMPIIMFAGGIVASLIDRLWWLAYLGAAAIAWTGAEMIVEDEWLHGSIADQAFLELLAPAAAVVIVVTFSHWFHRGRWRAATTKAGRVTTDKSSDSTDS